MAHTIGIATNPVDLLQQFVTWLQGLGWTVNMSQAEGSGWRAHLAKAGLCVNLRAAMNETLSHGGYYATTAGYGLGMNVSTGFDSAKNWYSQPGAPVQESSPTVGLTPCIKTGSTATPGPITRYYAFEDGADNVMLVVEGAPGIFSHLSWGPSLIQAGSWPLGHYCCASRSTFMCFSGSIPDGYTSTSLCPFVDGGDGSGAGNAYVRADVDSIEGKWLAVSRNITYSMDSTRRVPCETKFLASPLSNQASYPPIEIPRYGTHQFADRFQARQFTQFNSQIHLLPVPIYVQRDAGGWSLLGRVPNVYYCTATEHDVPAGSILSIGPDDYCVFPNFCVRRV